MGRRLDILNYTLIAGVEQEINLETNIDSIILKARGANDIEIRQSAGNTIYYNLLIFGCCYVFGGELVAYYV